MFKQQEEVPSFFFQTSKKKKNPQNIIDLLFKDQVMKYLESKSSI